MRPSTFFQRCRDQQWYINQLLKKQWHHETEIKQLKDRLRRESLKNKHYSSNSVANNGSSITEISPAANSTSSAISVGENCQLISVNLASTTSASASYSSSSASEMTDVPSCSGAKSKRSSETKHHTKRSSNSNGKSNTNSSKEKSSSSSSKYENFYNQCDQPDYINTNHLTDKRKEILPGDGKQYACCIFIRGLDFIDFCLFC